MKKPADWLNYQHLLYFWMVARHGTVAEASRRLHLTSPTVSAQIRKLEQAAGQDLFRPHGRLLKLTDAGEVAMRYAEQIFGLGAELAEALSGRLPEGKLRLRVGIVDAVPKLIVHLLLSPILQMEAKVMLECSEGALNQLLDQLTAHELDLVISDTQVPPKSGHRVFNHLLAESSISFFASQEWAPAMNGSSIEKMLSEFPLLMPSQGTALRRQLDRYFDDLSLSPNIAHEFTDSALLKVFGEAGAGIFPGSTLVADRIASQYSVTCLGIVEQVREWFYAITAERQIIHPAVETLVHFANRDRTHGTG